MMVFLDKNTIETHEKLPNLFVVHSLSSRILFLKGPPAVPLSNVDSDKPDLASVHLAHANSSTHDVSCHIESDDSDHADTRFS